MSSWRVVATGLAFATVVFATVHKLVIAQSPRHTALISLTASAESIRVRPHFRSGGFCLG